MSHITYSDTRRTERASVLVHHNQSWDQALFAPRPTTGDATDLTFRTKEEDLSYLVPKGIFRDE